MRKTLVALTALAALASAGPAGAATKSVAIRAAGFRPTAVTIQAGDQITWRNADTRNHQVVADNGSFASPILAPTRTYTFTFTRAGTFRYHDGLFPARTGRIVVQPPPPATSLTASSAVVTYGDTTRLAGAITTAVANETVAIFARKQNQPSYVQIATVLTGPGGVWGLDVRPGIATNYLARFRGVETGAIGISVRPRVRLSASRTHLFAKVQSDVSFAGRWLVLQRRTANGWVGVRRLQLGPRSGRLFRAPRRKTTAVYRVYLTQPQTVAGYLASWSGTQRVRKR